MENLTGYCYLPNQQVRDMANYLRARYGLDCAYRYLAICTNPCRQSVDTNISTRSEYRTVGKREKLESLAWKKGLRANVDYFSFRRVDSVGDGYIRECPTGWYLIFDDGRKEFIGKNFGIAKRIIGEKYAS